MSTAQTNALVVALIYERAGEPSFSSTRGVNHRTLTVLERRGLIERDRRGGYRLTGCRTRVRAVAQGRAATVVVSRAFPPGA
jgi:DNA-binding IclR family transcriptional regulator